ncbi:MAG: YfhO family protein [Magnetococcales bacterium]|nr:YfhO family protein [Magnetococcales bacterium]
MRVISVHWQAVGFAVLMILVTVWPYVWSSPQAALDVLDGADGLIPRLIRHGADWSAHGWTFRDDVQIGGTDRLAIDQPVWGASTLLFMWLPPLTAYLVYKITFITIAICFSFLLFTRRFFVDSWIAVVFSCYYGWVVFISFWDLFFNWYFAIAPGWIWMLARLTDDPGRRWAWIMAFGLGLSMGVVSSTVANLPYALITIGLYFLFAEPLRKPTSWVVLLLFAAGAVIAAAPVLIAVMRNLGFSHRIVFGIDAKGSNLFHWLNTDQWHAIPGALLLVIKQVYWGVMGNLLPLLKHQREYLYLLTVSGVATGVLLGHVWRTRRWSELKRFGFPVAFILLTQCWPLIFFFVPSQHLNSAIRPERALEYIHLPLILFCAQVLGQSLARKPMLVRGLVTVLACMILVRAWLQSHEMWDRIPVNGTQEELLSNPGIRQIAQRMRSESREPFRVASYRSYPGLVNAYGLDAVDGISALYPIHYYDYWKQVLKPLSVAPQAEYYEKFNTKLSFAHHLYLYPARPLDCNRSAERLAEGANLKLLALANTRFILSRSPLDDPELTLEEEVPYHISSLWQEERQKLRDEQFCPEMARMRVYRLSGTMPRAFGLFRVQTYADAQGVLDALSRAPLERLATTAFVTTRADLHQGPVLEGDGSGKAEVEWLEHAPDLERLQVRFSRTGILMISNTFHPDWNGYLDGQPVRLFPVDHTFTGLIVPPGEHRVDLYYCPWSFWCARKAQ